ncbi:MAG TPA: hypothetical protein ENK26_09580 [Gammaproteobacteria bacterium]|nr:hypothetical protein [Gammaproteobacteria bacterium]
MIAVLVFAVAVLLFAGLVVTGYFLALFRKDQLGMRKVLLALVAEMRADRQRLEKLQDRIDGVRREFSLQLAGDDDEVIAEAIRMARQGATAEQIRMTFDLRPSEANIIVSSHGRSARQETAAWQEVGL